MNIKDQDRMLEYDNQLEFKKWASANGLDSNNYYFDCTTPVDTRGWIQPDIPGLYADGSKTWREALDILKNYFLSSK